MQEKNLKEQTEELNMQIEEDELDLIIEETMRKMALQHASQSNERALLMEQLSEAASIRAQLKKKKGPKKFKKTEVG